jgi:hypothetical protein
MYFRTNYESREEFFEGYFLLNWALDEMIKNVIPNEIILVRILFGHYSRLFAICTSSPFVSLHSRPRPSFHD